MESSYIQNNYGEVFETLVEANRPVLLVELGVLNGYSTIHIGKAIRKNKERHKLNGHLYSYDLFENYPFKHGIKEEVEKRIKNDNLQEFITVQNGNAYRVYNKYADKSINFLHVDISNCGQVIDDIMNVWDKKIVQGGLVVFEGGSVERDNIDWMIKYKKKPIKHALESNKHIGKNYVYGTYLKFPSLTVCLKKFDNA